MGLIAQSVVNSKNATSASLLLPSVSAASAVKSLPTLASPASSAVTSVLSGSAAAAGLSSVSNGISVSAASIAASGGAAGLAATGTLTAGLKSATSGVQNFLNSALSSVTSLLNGNVKAFASSIDSRLGQLFVDTNQPSVSTVTTSVSDPVKTNLMGAKTPLSSSFKITPLASGSQAVSGSGYSSAFGSNAASMIGTSLSTVQNRFNLDSTGNIASAISNAMSTKALAGLYTGTLSSLTSPSSLANVASRVVNSTPLGQSALAQTLLSVTTKLTPLTQATGVNAAAYLLGTKAPTLIDEVGTPLVSSVLGVSTDVAQSVVDIGASIGCSALMGRTYTSSAYTMSLFNAAINTAALNGLDSLLAELLGCNVASNAVYFDDAQTAIASAAVQAAPTNLSTTSQLVDALANPAALNTPSFTTDLMTNSNLSSQDYSALNTTLTKLGSNVSTALGAGTISDDTVKVYNQTTLASMDTSLRDTCAGTTAISTFLNGRTMSIDSNGLLAAA